jgi:hypothetical protein
VAARANLESPAVNGLVRKVAHGAHLWGLRIRFEPAGQVCMDWRALDHGLTLRWARVYCRASHIWSRV